MGLEDNRLWSIYVRLRNGLDREFTVFADEIKIESVRLDLINDDDVSEVDVAEEYGDMSVQDFLEELAVWKSDELD